MTKYNKNKGKVPQYFHLHTAHKIDKAIHFHNRSQLNIYFFLLVISFTIQTLMSR